MPVPEVSPLSRVGVAVLSEEDAVLSVVDDKSALSFELLSLLEALSESVPEFFSSELFSFTEVSSVLLSSGTEFASLGIICGVDVLELAALELEATGLLALDELPDGFELETLLLLDVVVELLLLDVLDELLPDKLDELPPDVLEVLDELLVDVLDELLPDVLDVLLDVLEELELAVVSELLSSRRTYFMLLSFAYCAAFEPEYV